MRTIDADSLYRRIKTECNPYGKPTIDFESGKRVLDIIDNAPTVEPTFGLFRTMFCETCQAYATNRAIAKLADEYTRPQDQWIPVSERLPEEKINPQTHDFEEVLCTTIWGDVRAYKFGKPIGHDKPHFWLGGGIMDDYVIAWMPLPEPYKKGGAE